MSKDGIRSMRLQRRERRTYEDFKVIRASKNKVLKSVSALFIADQELTPIKVAFEEAA
ncbi:MAG: hypothetical protein KTR30_30940 [Saprospiraceae bacterium]|nr:hypothetical protein [Saprospiraceae bacterium]